MHESETSVAATTGGATGTPRPGAHTIGPLAPGAAFGSRYRVLKVLGAGGMGVVYQAWDQELGVAVALKVIRPEAIEDPAAARDVERRFKQELLLARQVTHKHVVRIHDLGEIDGIKYLTMPCVEGQDLSTILRESEKLPVRRALSIARQIASGLSAAHDVGVVHRDLKPENVMIGADDHAVIMDFGIARSLSATGTRTALGAVIGTLEYMAPEQGQGQPVDHRADIYSFGLILYDMLVGRRRSAISESAIVELMARVKQAPPSARSIEPAVPDALDRLVSRCLDPDPAKRYQTTAALLADLERLDAEGRALPAATRPPSLRWTAAAGVALLALLAGGALWWSSRSGAGTAPPARDPISVLVTDFTNRAGDPVFEGTVEQALTIALEGASFITTYPRASAMRAVQLLNPGAPLDEATGRLVSQREGIRVILAGAIAASGDGYEISVRALDPALDAAADQTLFTASRSASNKDGVLAAVGQLAADIRRQLGDSDLDDLEAARETFTSADLGAAREYALAQRLAQSGKDEQALVHYQRAVERDPEFGRAYSGWATSALKLGQRAEARRLYDEAIKRLERMTERERYRTLGAYHIAINRDFDKGIENYSALVEKYPADGAGHNNLAVAYFNVLDFPKALEQGRQLLDIYPQSVLYRYNYALYAMYAGQFDTAAREAARAIELNPDTPKAYLALAMAALAQGKRDEARAAYERAQAAGPRGASLASMGLADLAMLEGRFTDAIAILKTGIEADEAARNPAAAAAKRIALAEAQLAAGNQPAALAALDAALPPAGIATAPASVLVPAAGILIDTGHEARAKRIAAELDGRLSAHDRAYAAMIQGQIALRDERLNEALRAFREAKNRADLWLVRFHFGVAEAQAGAGAYVSALADLDACRTRLGEATAVFLDDVPSFRYAPPVTYWLGRVQEGMGNAAAAAEHYKAYLAARGDAADDRLAADARRRLARQ